MDGGRRRKKTLIAAYSALLPIFIFIIYEIAWLYSNRAKAGKVDLVNKDFPSTLLILAVTFILPSFSVLCGGILLSGVKSRVHAIIIFLLSVLLVTLSVLLRPV